MSDITDPTSVSLGWANFNTDYLASNPTNADAALTQALSDAQNGTSGAVPGGTIYFPPPSGRGHVYNFSQSHVITGSCAMVSTGKDDVTLQFQLSGGTTQRLHYFRSECNTARVRTRVSKLRDRDRWWERCGDSDRVDVRCRVRGLEYQRLICWSRLHQFIIGDLRRYRDSGSA